MNALIYWILVTERLPMGEEKDNEVLVSVIFPESGKIPFTGTGWYDEKNKVWRNATGPFPPDSINAWAVFPHPIRA